jgi:sporulation protein YlmC with PRC-barrel domain
MILKKNDLINLPVYTRSNQHLGRVADFEVDPQTQQIVRYEVKSGGIIGDLLSKELLVSREQVVSISPEKMVVEDTAVPYAEQKKEAAKSPAVVGQA